MSDPTSPETHDYDYVDCDICGRINTVTVWVQPRTGAWVRESFTCYCGEYHGEIDGNDRGATTLTVAFIAAGLALLTIGAIGALGGHWPQGFLMIAGLCFAAAPFARKDPSND